MGRYGWKLTPGKSELQLIFGTTEYLAFDSTGIGFFNTTPAAQPSAYTQTYSTADKTIAAPTAAAVGDLVSTTAGWGANSEANFDKIWDAIDKLVADDLDNRKAITAIIDDLQALGLVQ